LDKAIAEAEYCLKTGDGQVIDNVGSYAYQLQDEIKRDT